MKKLSLSALAAAGLMAGTFATGANAADLGGNCCADLEERIAELEATTARKGNRKVSLTLSGWVAEQIMFWDDGHESNAYVTGIGTTLASNFKLSGQATIAPGWSAGYLIHIEANTGDTFVNNQFSDESNRVDLPDLGFGTRTLQSYWFVKSDHYGKVSLGRLSQASDNTAILVDGSGSLVPANWVLFEGSGFFMRNANLAAALGGPGAAGANAGNYTNFVWGNIAQCHLTNLGIGADCNGVPLNVIRYDSPTFAGFSVSSSWGEDDMWDVAARYAGEHAGFKVAVAAAYTESTDENTVGPDELGSFRDVSYFQIGAYLQHVATGLFVYGAYGKEEVDHANFDPAGDGVEGENYSVVDPEHWYIKAGIRCRMTPLGHTVVYGEYGQYSDQLSAGMVDTLNITGAGGSEMEIYGGGIVQEVDAAAMSIWLHYRHMESEVSGINVAGVNSTESFEDLDIVKFGALINF